MAVDSPASGRLNEMIVLTLVMVGDDDLSGFHKIADILHKNIRNFRKAVLSGVGHMPYMGET